MLKTNQSMLLMHFWLNRVTASAAQSITQFAWHTISAFYVHFHKLVASNIADQLQIIGGQDVIVEVDETRLGKRKYHRGHRVEGMWVVVGVERTEARRLFLVGVEDRKADTLHDIIREHVSLESIIHTDGWKGYSAIEEEFQI